MNNIVIEKFGGASINSAAAVKNVITILRQQNDRKRVIVVSAMGKTTNALEKVVNMWHTNKRFNIEEFERIKEYHKGIAEELFDTNTLVSVLQQLEDIFEQIKERIKTLNPLDYNFLYDNIVSYGERLSSTIISLYMNHVGLKHRFADAQNYIKTDNTFRAAQVDWKQTQKSIDKDFDYLFDGNDLILTQGFIGSTREGYTTTLGREGSDYSAAIFAYCLDADSLTIWKDVSGLMNADPKRMDNTVKLNIVPYKEAIELSYYGASIIHPKTIKPLENKSIPLYVRSFNNPELQGSIICHGEQVVPLVPNYIFKEKQTLLSVSTKDFSFIAEDNIANIFSILSKHGVKVNLIQNSALTFSVCFEHSEFVLQNLIDDLQQFYNVKYNNDLHLITIRHYTEDSIKEATKNSKILIEQKNRVTIQCLIKPETESA